MALCSALLLGVPALAGVAADGDPPTPMPAFTVETPWEIWGQSAEGLEAGDVVEVYVNPDETRVTFDEHWSVEVVQEEWGLGWWLHTEPFELVARHGEEPGQLVVVDFPTGESKDLELVPLEVTGVDEELDTVAGTAEPGTTVEVDVGDEFGGAHRTVTADEGGVWVADFSVDEGEGSFDLTEGMGGSAQVFDQDGDSVHRGICLGDCAGEAQAPSIAVWPDQDMLRIEGPWEVDREVTFTIAADAQFNEVLFTETIPNEGWVEFTTDGFDIQRGMWVAADDGLDRAEHHVQSLFVDGYDADLDTVFGRAVPGSLVTVQAGPADGGGGVASVRRVVAGLDADDGTPEDGLGPWLADFSVAGTDPDADAGPQEAFDIGIPGAGVVTEQRQADGETDVDLTFPNPAFSVETPSTVWSSSSDELEVGAFVDVYVNPDEGRSSYSHHEQVEVFANEWGEYFWVELGYEFGPGDTVVVDYPDGITSKSLVVESVTVDPVDPATDQVTGTAAFGKTVEVDVGDESSGAHRTATADGDGVWVADFSVDEGEGSFDLTEGMGGSAQVFDQDGDSTHRGICLGDCDDGGGGYEPGPPIFDVEPALAHIHGRDWIDATEVTITVDDPATAEDPDITVSTPVEDWGEWEPGSFEIGLWDHEDVNQALLPFEPGFEVTVTDGTTTKTHVVTELTMTGADVDTDQLFGTAEPYSEVWIVGGNEQDGFEVTTSALGDGTWTADLAPFDLAYEMGGEAVQRDEDDDATVYRFQLPQPRLSAEPVGDDRVWIEWPTMGEALDVTVSGLADGSSWTTSVTTEQQGESFFEVGVGVEIPGDLVAGSLIELFDPATGELLRSHEVLPLEITHVGAAGTVSGRTEPFATVSVQAGHIAREVTADGYGNWTADLSVPGPQEYEQDTIGSLLEIEGIGVFRSDEDGDSTMHRGWGQERDLNALPAFDRILGRYWQIGTEVSVTVDRTARGQGSATFTTVAVEEGEWAGTGNGDGFFNLHVDDGLGLEPEDVVTVADDLISSEMVVDEITVTEVDLAADAVHGTTTPHAFVWVLVGDSPEHEVRMAEADELGAWTADFSTPQDPDGPEGPNPTFDAFDLTTTTAAMGYAGRHFETPSEHSRGEDATIFLWTLDATWMETFAPEGAVLVGEPATVGGTFGWTFYSDGDIPLMVDWGDGQSNNHDWPPLVSGVGEAELSHTYEHAGTYTVTLKLMLDIERVTVVVVDDAAGGDVDPGGTVTTDDGGDGATADDPVETSFTAPTAGSGSGTVTITEGTSSYEPDGFKLLGTTVSIGTDVVGTTDDPIVLTLTLDASAIPAGETVDTIQIFRNGDPVPDCDVGVDLPCVFAREVLGDGDLAFTIHTLYASEWSMGAVPPQIVDLSVTPEAPIPAVTGIVSADVGVHDRPDSGAHEVTWDWGDGTATSATPVMLDDAGDGSASATHTYADSGVFTVTATFTRTAGGGSVSDSQTYSYVVVYDGDRGFVTGGGWIDSPSGAYPADPDAAGRATFGFVSKYKKGAFRPTGDTDFEFQTVGFDFASTDYQWLVVLGKDKAKFKGTGSVNGQDGYGFMLTATDGGRDGPDLFRIKIWELGTELVVYDNQPAEGAYGFAGTELGGGSIVVHAK